MRPTSPTSHRVYDFQVVSIKQRRHSVLGAGNDAAIALDNRHRVGHPLYREKVMDRGSAAGTMTDLPLTTISIVSKA